VEAADLEWWWRSERASDSIDQAFWLDETGEPVGAVVLTDWHRKWGCDLLVVPSRPASSFRRTIRFHTRSASSTARNYGSSVAFDQLEESVGASR